MVGNDESRKFYESVGKNIRKYRIARNYSLEQLGGLIGVVKKTVQRYEIGEIKLDMHRLADIANALDVSLPHLLDGTESFLGVDPEMADVVKIPILGFVPAGGPVMVEENLEGYMPLPRILMKGNNDFVLRVRGDSMEDMGISNGDMVLVHPQVVADNGRTVIARVGGEVTCKRFYRLNGLCRLEPANSKYKPIECEDIEIIGIVTRVIKEVL